ncbi:hypothetical protein Tco_0011425 [Tanacetum coccineum]
MEFGTRFCMASEFSGVPTIPQALRSEKTIEKERNRLEVKRPFEERRQLLAAEKREGELKRNDRYLKPAAGSPRYI